MLAMADPDEQCEKREQLRADFNEQTARIEFTELQRHFAAGRLILVGDDLDLVRVAVELALDNADTFQRWVNAGSVAGVSDEQAREWLATDCTLWAVVADPWVLVQLNAPHRGG